MSNDTTRAAEMWRIAYADLDRLDYSNGTQVAYALGDARGALRWALTQLALLDARYARPDDTPTVD